MKQTSVMVRTLNEFAVTPQFLHKHVELCAVAKAVNLDVMCIVEFESWLNTDVLNTEVVIRGYQSHKLDRNDVKARNVSEDNLRSVYEISLLTFSLGH